jgi:2-dehydropantoate 2-reductase
VQPSAPNYSGAIMRIMVFGTGGAGGFFGARLALAGEDVIFIARGEHLRAIRNDGLRVEMPEGEVVVSPAQATDDPAEITGVEVVLVGVKAWQVREAARTLQPAIGPETFVVPLQNGVDATSELGAVLGSGHVLAGLCGTFSWITAPGRIRSVGTANFIKFAELDNRPSDRALRLQEVFRKAGVAAEVPPDIHKALWEKFLTVTSLGGVGAVTRAPIGVTRALPETRRLLEQCMNEVFAVARSREIELADTIVADTMTFITSLTANSTTSLQRDITDGKPSELEYWNGAVVRLARERNIPAPTHEFIYHSLLPQERRARGIDSSIC